jgi:ABC-type branched-subunit amino acid transport system permease subunit
MRPRDWYLGIALLALALIFHAAFPRYEYRTTGSNRVGVRVDRWTGTATVLRAPALADATHP